MQNLSLKIYLLTSAHLFLKMEQQQLFNMHFKVEKVSLMDLKWLAQISVTQLGLELKCTEENVFAVLCYIRHVVDIITHKYDISLT